MLGSLPSLDPNTRHLGDDLAVAVLAHSAAWPIAQVLRASHRAGHPAAVQHALAAHAAVEEWDLAHLLAEDEGALHGAARSEPAAKGA